MKVISLVIMALLVTGVLATLVLAENEEIGTAEEAVSETSLDSQEVTASLNEVDEAIADTDERLIGPTKVNLGSGWGLTTDNKNAEMMRIVWATKSYKSGEAQIKNKSNVIKKDNSNVSYSSFGRFFISISGHMEKFKLVKKEISDNRVSFYVLPVNKGYIGSEEAKNASIGTLTLNKKQYTHMVLWNGKLTLDSGNYVGDWSVSLASKTRIYAKQSTPKDNEEPKKVEKVSFWQKLFGKKAKVNESAGETA